MASSQNKRPNAQNYNNDGFLEAFRDLGKAAVSDAKSQLKQAVTADIPSAFGFDSLPKQGDLSPNEALTISDLKKAKKEGFDQANQSFEAKLASMRREGELVVQKEQQTVRQQIQAIQQEVKGLAKSMGEFAYQVEIATSQAPVNPGIYHRNFFIHLKTVIFSMRQRAESSKNWLATHNQRAGKRGYFWGQVKKSGTSYMLSGERYAVMSTG